jgi:hypothetical protein
MHYYYSVYTTYVVEVKKKLELEREPLELSLGHLSCILSQVHILNFPSQLAPGIFLSPSVS